jgi:undecaprenyl-diphosphatase
MLLMDVKPEQAFRLSYLAYIPASLGAFFVTLLLSKSQVDTAIQTVEPTGVVIAILAAAIIRFFVISYLLKFAKTNKIYLVDFVLGAIALIIGVVATVLAPSLS